MRRSRLEQAGSVHLLCRYDKRAAIAKRDAERQIQRALRRRT
ncbi:MAG: hypothetical protein WD379_02460 [Dehalococcoidia bacterium]